MIRQNQRGFTVIELLLATTFFSVIIMMVTAGFIQINRSYTRGTIVRNMQNNARVLFEDISRTIRDSTPGGLVYSNTQPYRICVPGIRYGWNQFNGSGRSTESLPAGTSMVKSYDTGTCTGAMPANATSPLGENMIVQHMAITPIVPGNNRTVRFVMVISSPTAELTTQGENAQCRTAQNSQYCDVVRLESVITLRNND